MCVLVEAAEVTSGGAEAAEATGLEVPKEEKGIRTLSHHDMPRCILSV